MKFLHAADIHLDSPLCGLSAYPDAPAERLRTATRSAFVRLIDTALAEQVDFLVIAGDLYDGGWKDFNTGLFFVRQMGRLQQAGIPVYLMHGNHDADSDMTSRLVLPENVHVFNSRKAQTFRIDALRVALHGHSFRTRETLEAALAVLGYVDQRLEPSIYEATPGTLAALLDRYRDTERVLLVGHNPELERLVALLHG